MASNWDDHKETIQALYSDGKRSLDDVMSIMKEAFQFSASKSGYERQLKQWGIRKNRHTSHMKFLKLRLEQRQQRKKESHVLLDGVLLSNSEIERKTTRCYITLPERYKLERCHTPEGVTVVTPTTDNYMACVRSRDLPWIYFLGQLPSIRNLNMLIDMPPQTLRAIIPAMCPRKSVTITEHLEHSIHHLSAILPVKRNEDIYSILHHIVGTDYAGATIQILKLTLYLLSNKLLEYRTQTLVCDELLRWFQMGDNYLILKNILSHRLPTIEAFAEGIFASALEVQDRQMVKIFLASGMNPNLIILGPRVYQGQMSHKGTPLQIAAEKRNLGIIKLLLSFHADVDQTSGERDVTPLGIAASNGDMKIAQLLISRGAAVNRLDRRMSPLQNAALSGHSELAKILLDHGADINSRCTEESFPVNIVEGCPLECAIRARAVNLVDMLLERGADIDCQAEPQANTPLQSAAMIDDHEMVQRLLQMGADINAPAPKDYGSARTALQWAAKNGNFQLCQVLMVAGADPNGPPAANRHFDWPAGTTALTNAVLSKNHQIVELLLKHGAEVNDTSGEMTALEAAVQVNDIAMTQLLLSAQADPALGKPLVFAVENQNFELISMLLAAGPDVNTMNEGLCKAVENHDSDLVQLLLKAGADPNPTSGYPLVIAAGLGNLVMIEILLLAGADCNARENEPHCYKDGSMYLNLNALQAAAAKGNMELVQRLLIAGADLNYPPAQDFGRTALQVAVQSRNLELIQFLIEKGADLNSPAAEYEGVTALQAAISGHRDDEALVRILLAAGANANDAPSPEGGRTSLQRAAANGDDDLICLLLEHGAAINAPAADIGGDTALRAAAWMGHYGTVLLLLTKGAHANAPASRVKGFTALEAAAMNGYLHIAEILLNAGANVNAWSAVENPYYGHTALEAAASRGRIDMLKLLLNAGADITSDFGRSQLKEALRLATEHGHNAAAKFLKYHQIC